jgi:cytochrome oxidase Cu insertion factor (SCO1/SenC/PrrC family)
VPFGIVLEGNRFPRKLSRYTAGAITLLSFFYSYCADPNGCPLAFEAFEQVRQAILARPELGGRVRLVFLSLDPAHDTPDVLKNFARRYEESAKILPWHFLTTYSYLFLNPVLHDMGEEISIDRGASSTGGLVLNHLLKVYLIDTQGWVREIYSNQSLDPAAILGDMETLSLETDKVDDH